MKRRYFLSFSQKNLEIPLGTASFGLSKIPIIKFGDWKLNFLKIATPFFLLMCNCRIITLVGYEEKIDTIVNHALTEFNVPGAAVAVVVDGKTVVCRGYGMRDLEHQLPVNVDTIFPIASNTKAFTSFLIAQLVAEGKLDWDKPIIEYLPEFHLSTEALTQQVTLRDLIAHRTGVPRHDALWIAIRDLSEEEVLEILPYFPPSSKLRETFVYNNFMYTVAAKVVREVTKSPWEVEMASKILGPLHMDRSGTMNPLQRDNVAQPYAAIGGKVQTLSFHYPSSILPAGGIHSTVTDMTKWLRVHLDKTQSSFIKKEALEEMHTIHMPFTAKTGTGYGLGWEIDSYRNRKQVRHGGLLEGFTSEVAFLPDEKIGIIILTNSSTDGRTAIYSIKNSIYDYLLGAEDRDWAHKFLQERANESEKTATFSWLKYEGNYIHPAYGQMSISQEYDTLYATVGKARLELHSKSENIFEAKCSRLLAFGVDPTVQFSFIINSLGEVDEVHVPFEQFRSAPAIVFKKCP